MLTLSSAHHNYRERICRPTDCGKLIGGTSLQSAAAEYTAVDDGFQSSRYSVEHCHHHLNSNPPPPQELDSSLISDAQQAAANAAACRAVRDAAATARAEAATCRARSAEWTAS